MDEDQAPTAKSKVTSIVLALIAAGGLVFASLAHAWAVDPIGDHTGYGLRARQDCDDRGCVTTPFLEVKATMRQAEVPTPTLRAFGWATAIASWIAAGALVLAALLVAIDKLIVRPVAPTTIGLLALVVALISGCVFVAQARMIGTVGWNFWVFGVAVVVGIVGAQGLARFKPGDPFWDDPPTATDDLDKW
jgi:hypothetical protein